MFAAILTDCNLLQPFRLSIFPVSLTCLIKSNKVLLFHFHDGNSRIIVNALHPFSNVNAFIRIFLLFVDGAMFVNINYAKNDAAA